LRGEGRKLESSKPALAYSLGYIISQKQKGSQYGSSDGTLAMHALGPGVKIQYHKKKKKKL
jgi:hypothetical protein